MEPQEALAGVSKVLVLPWSGSTTVQIPAGTADGALLRLPGLGPAAADGSPLDAHVLVRVRTAPPPYATTPPPYATVPPPPYATTPPPFPTAPPQLAAKPSPFMTAQQPSTAAPPQFMGAPGVAAPWSGNGPPVPVSPARRRAVLVVAAVAVVAVLAAVGLIFTLLPDGKGKNPAPVAAAAASTTSGAPVTPEQYQATLTGFDSAMAAAFRSLAAAKNPHAVTLATAGISKTITEQRATLADLTPPATAASAHADLLGGLLELSSALAVAGSVADSWEVCVGPAATAQLSRDAAVERLRGAFRTLASADPAHPYRVGAFIPAKTEDANRRLSTGSYLKRTQGGLGRLKIENNGTVDTVFSVVRGKTVVDRIYVRSKSTATVRGIPDGTYQVYFVSGIDWDSRFKAFGRDCGFERFDSTYKFTTTSRSYTEWTLSLLAGNGGNASSSDVDPDQFPAG
ncbi:hypothetical protein ACFFWC_00840 [Plantactinospora siamensis]|uniref:Uncharacterized protein n=1 Tax=Plantactinospora siamensis TaxID=555372 RepID=A0ABV6NTP3_9ACTN